MKENNMRFMIPININTCLQDAHNHEIVYFFENDERKRHPGTDGRETQWENEVLPNYRNVYFEKYFIVNREKNGMD